MPAGHCNMENSDPKTTFDFRLKQLLRRVQARVLVHGFLRFLAVGAASSLAAIWSLGGAGESGGFIGTGLGISLFVGLLILFWLLLVKPWRRLRRCRDLVRLLETRGNFANLLVSAEEACRLPGRWGDDDPIVLELKRRLFKRSVAILEILDPVVVYPVTHRSLTGTTLVLTGLLGAWLFGVVPHEMSRGLSRLLHPRPEMTVPATGGLYAAARPNFVVAGNDFEVAAVDFAGGLEATVYEIKTGTGSWRSVSAKMEWIYPDRIGLPPPARRWTGSIEAVHEGFTWRFRRGSLITAETDVRVRHHPLMRRLQVRVQPPEYTELPVQDLARLPSWIEVPVGSTLHLAGRVNHPVEQGLIVTSPGDTLELDVDGDEVSRAWLITEPHIFRLELENGFGLRNQSPVRYEVAVAPDQDPAVHLERPGDDGILPIEGELSLNIEAVDDFGLARLDLLLRVVSREGRPAGEWSSSRAQGMEWDGGSFWFRDNRPVVRNQDSWISLATRSGVVMVRPVVLSAAGNPGLGIRLALEVRAGALDLIPGDVLELVIQGQDNRRPGEPGIGRSNVLRLVLPSAADVLTEQAQANEEHKSDLQEMRRRGRELGADLDRLNRELLKNPLPDWARQQEMEAAIQRQKSLQEELSRVSDEIRQELDRLAESQLASRSMMEKTDEVAALLEKSFSDQLQDLLQKMENSSDRITPQEVAQAVREVAKDQKELARRLDAALAMLERMSREQELEGMTAMLEKMMRKQQELAELSQGDHEQANDTAEEQARQQEALAQELEELHDKLEQALESLKSKQGDKDSSEEGEQYEKALSEALSKIEEQIQKDSMNKAAEDLQKMDPEKAAQMQQQAMRDLGALYHVLMNTQEAMEMAMQNKQVSSLRRLAADLLTLSARQEEINTRIPVNLREVRSQNLTRGEHRLQKSAAGIRDRLAELMDESPRQVMILLRKLDDLIEEMGRCVGAMGENRSTQARRHASASLGQANSIVIKLLTQAQMAGGSGGSGSPMPSASEQLQKMAREQAGLNGSTEQIRQMLANRGISQAVRAQMKRLGEAQGGLASELEDLAKKERENPQGERILGDLEDLGRRMEQVSREMDQGLVSEETLVRQDRILSRLLDAHNSVRRRDYSNRRESHTASRLYDPQSGPVGDAASEENLPQRLRFQPLNKAPLEYRDLVRRYFSALDSLRLLDDELPGIDPGKTREQKIQ